MKFRLPGSFKTPDAFRERLAELGLAIELDDTVEAASGPLAQPHEWAPGRTLANRFAIHPMEGWDGTPEGGPTDLTLRRWYHFGRSGAALIWGCEAFAVQADGRANANQLFLREGDASVRDLEQLRAEVLRGREEIGASGIGPIGLQLTHSGRWSRPKGPHAPRPVTRDVLLDARVGGDAPLLTDDELAAIQDRYVAAAHAAARAGFDFVDVKACHGYLIHELLGARAREGKYGGPAFEDRTRFFVEVVERIQSEVPGLAIGCRVSLADVVPHQPSKDHDDRRGEPAAVEWAHGFGVDVHSPTEFDLDEPQRFLALLESLDVRLVNITLGSPYYNPHLQRPAAYPPSDGYQPFADPLVFVAEHLDVVRRAKAAHPDLTFVGTGYTYLMDWLANVAQAEVRSGGVDVVGLGRMVLSYPEMPRDSLEGRTRAKKLICRTFSDCTTAPRNGMVSGCYPLDPDYRARPEHARLAEIKRALREEADR